MVGQLRSIDIKDALYGPISATKQGNQIKTDFLKDMNYAFAVTLTQQENDSLSMYLQNSQSGQKQNLVSFLVEGFGNIGYITTFSPNDNYDTLVMEGQDASSISEYTVVSLKNLLNNIGVNQVKKIGVQSAPGMLMNINGEAIRVGRFGIYELVRNIDIYFICMIPVFLEGQLWILDYQY